MSRPDGVRRAGHCANGNHYDCSGHLGCHCECHAEPSPAAPAAEADLRTELLEALWGANVRTTTAAQATVDDVLALPALQRLVAEAAEARRLRETVARVEALVASGEQTEAETAAEGDPVTVYVYVRQLRRALDGTDV